MNILQTAERFVTGKDFNRRSEWTERNYYIYEGTIIASRINTGIQLYQHTPTTKTILTGIFSFNAAKTDCPYNNRTLAVILQALNHGIAVFDNHNNRIDF